MKLFHGQRMLPDLAEVKPLNLLITSQRYIWLSRRSRFLMSTLNMFCEEIPLLSTAMMLSNNIFAKSTLRISYHIQPNYHTYPSKCTVKQFHILQITASVLFVYFFIKAYIVGTHLNCIDLLMVIHGTFSAKLF